MSQMPIDRATSRPHRFANPLLLPPTRPMPANVGVVGAGTIGPDIGYYLASALPDLRLVLVDVAQAALDAARRRIDDYAAKALARGKLARRAAESLAGRITGTLDYGALAGCDWVIEAATEDLALKRRIFASVEAIVTGDALITSNTSSLPAKRIFADLARPQRATVTHFFAPAWRNPIVEVIDWERVEPAVVDHLRRVFCATGKVPLVTADVACFMLDRVFDNWCNEAALLLEGNAPSTRPASTMPSASATRLASATQGAAATQRGSATQPASTTERAPEGPPTAAQIDSVAGELVHAGPFFVLNLANGNPIIVETNDLQADEEGEHYRPARIFRSVERWRTGRPGTRVDVPDATAARIRDRLLGVLLSQSVDILDRGIGEPADLEIGCRLALGFRQGPLAIVDRLGEREATRVLDRFADERGGMPLPRRALAEYGGGLRRVLVDVVDRVAVLTIRRPEALNALDDAITDELAEAIRARQDDPAIAGFVIIGYGTRAFSAGADIGRFTSMLGDADAAVQYSRDCSRLLVALDRMRKPVVAALNGFAFGGGLELALRCHAMVALRSARLQFPEITLGIVPGIGGMVVPYRRWPDAAPVLDRMLRRAEPLSATDALAHGIVDVLADDYPTLVRMAVDRVHAGDHRSHPVREGPIALEPPAPGEPTSAAGQVLSAAVLAILDRATRDAARAETLEQALEIGYRAFGESACTAAAREGIEAFQSRRAPDFGRTG